jgi:eukaryotic-like serine/threonine-protein kinase
LSALKTCPQCGTEYELDQRFCPKDGSTLRMPDASGNLVGSIVADRYHVLRMLGEGGMGQVYLAEHVKMGRKSALKVMRPNMVADPDAISRFNREASNAARINHPNVAAVYDFGETSDGIIYLAMEFVEGEPLTELLTRQGSLPPSRAAEIVRQTGDALAVAHDMGIVHRDLKPDNIMMTKHRDGSDLVKVVDFGIAKAANSEAQKVTKTGLVVGTPEYMSPEQLAGDKLDGRSDIYSLALVGFAMLTGHLPFPSETVQESMIMRLTDKPKRLSEMRREVDWPEEVQQVMDRALERDAGKRYTTATEFARDLVRAIERMPDSQVAAGGTLVMDVSVAPTQGMGAAKAAAAAGPADPAAGAMPEAPPPPPTVVDQRALAPAAEKSKVPILAAAGLVAVLVAGGGWYAMKGSGNAGAPEANGPTQSGVTASAPATTVVTDSLERLRAKFDVQYGTADEARNVLRQVRQLQSERQITTALDSTNAALVLVRAHMILGLETDSQSELRTACELARGSVQLARRTGFFPQFEPLIKTCDDNGL